LSLLEISIILFLAALSMVFAAYFFTSFETTENYIDIP